MYTFSNKVKARQFVRRLARQGVFAIARGRKVIVG
jgi:hypothetical protein